jgi:hypothetical protein
VLALVLLLLPGVAYAGSGESALSVGAGFGTWTLPGEMDNETLHPTAGGVLVTDYERGFSESFSWRVELQLGGYGGGGLSYSSALSAGLVYRFDVLKYVPYGLVELGGSYVGGGPNAKGVLDPMVEVGGGLDILRGRDRSWGIEGLIGGFAGDTMLIALDARYTWRWGFF